MEFSYLYKICNGRVVAWMNPETLLLVRENEDCKLMAGDGQHLPKRFLPARNPLNQ